MSVQDFDLSGKVAIVTGGNGGIGLGMAQGLARAGAQIMVAARDAAKSRDAVATLAAHGTRIEACSVDVADKASVAAMVAATHEAFGRIDILVNNAGINIRKQPEAYEEDEFRQVIDINLHGSYLCAHASYEAMKAAGGGKIINIGSMMSIFGASFSAPYAASKGGVVQLTKALASAWAKDNIQVNAILPGWIDTDLTRTARTQVTTLHDSVLARTPAARWGDARDFEGIAVFLASPASEFLTGTAIPVDGGFSIQG
ncbi:MAG: glucose 1-dehydrogenase [Pseudomonadota bacterium]